MNKSERMADDYNISLYEYHKTRVELLIVELELADTILCWLDRQQVSFPSAAEKVQSLMIKMVEQIEQIEADIEYNFDRMLEVNGLLA